MEPCVPLRDPVRAYLDLRLGLFTNRDLISHAQDRLSDTEVPIWVEELAYLRSHEVVDARGVLESYLMKQGVLPDSSLLRQHIRAAVMEWADRTAASGVVEGAPYTPTVVKYLHLSPGYHFSNISIPVEEFPYPPSGIQSAMELAQYIRDHIDSLVPLTPAATA